MEETNFGLNRATFSPKGWIGAVLFVALFLFTGLGTLGLGLAMALKAGESLSWPKSSGTIEVSRVINAYSSGSVQMYRVDVQYRYAVGDQLYTSNQIVDGGYSGSDWREMQRVAARYLPKQNVDVYYNPKQPDQALLEPGYGSTAWIAFLIGGIFTLAGGGMGLGLVWVYRRPYTPPVKPARAAPKRKKRSKETDDAGL